ncbi:hypothetical protein ACFLQ6_02460 [Thermoproteota archaeon]
MRNIQRIFSLVLLIILISIPIYYSWPTPRKDEVTAVKLTVRVFAESETRIILIVSAVDEAGQLDTKRDDEVELSFEGVTTSKLSDSRVTLEKGEAEVGIEVLLKESSFLKATWISGPTPLRDAKILVSPLMWDY